jgi:arylsulfatase A-like enzyme
LRNILVIRADSFRPDALGAYGSHSGLRPATAPRPRIETPNVDRLAAGGVLFEQAYCAQPVCAPSRASFYTGLYPHAHGVCVNNIPLPREVPTVAELLRPAGYACGHIGLWHQGDELRPQRGFEDFWISTEENYTVNHEADGYSSYHHFLVSRGYTPTDPHRNGRIFKRTTVAQLPEAVGKPAFQAQEAIRFLDTYRAQPFLLIVDFLEPHPPYSGPFDGRYAAGAMTLPPTWYQPLEATVPARFRARREALAHHNPHVATNDEAGWKELMARYWGQCTLVDKYAGRILSRLSELGLAGDTVIVFTSDHGEMMGEHRLLAKGVPYEGAIRVPLVVRIPGTTPGRVAAPVSQVSLLPTLLQAVGAPIPSHLQGKSLLPLMVGGDSRPRHDSGSSRSAGGSNAALEPDDGDEAVVVEWNGYTRHAARIPAALRPGPEDEAYRLGAVDVRTIRCGRWKLNVHGTGEHELYDLLADPGEQHNAFHDAGSGAVISALYDRLRSWQRKTRDTATLPDPRD